LAQAGFGSGHLGVISDVGADYATSQSSPQ